MRSQHADLFNHDEDAPRYDADVLNESDPIRTGYQNCLDWVANGVSTSLTRTRREATTPPAAVGTVIDLGSGTGNLTERLPRVNRLFCVDVSTEMHALAKEKLADRPEVVPVQQDLLEYLHELVTTDAIRSDDGPMPVPGTVDVVASTYAIHHLLENEKAELFAFLSRTLAPGGAFICGDLMFENEKARAAYLESCRQSGKSQLADDIEEEFFWDVELAREGLDRVGFTVETKQFSVLSWGLFAQSR